MTSTVAALYVDPLGVYQRMATQGYSWAGSDLMRVSLDCWDATRDARLYDGPHPVVAHPPCGPWGRLRHLYRGNEHDCAPRAVEQVRRWGGVLEHPAGSLLWEHCQILLPRNRQSSAYEARPVGYTIEVDQCEWGHVARKRTWLYLVGVPREAITPPPFPGREPTHAVTGGRHYEGRKHRGYTGSLKCCSAQQRRRTPPLFAEWLVSLATSAADGSRS